MTFTVHKSSVKTLKTSHPEFYISDGFVTSPRAGFEISVNCPREYKLILAECINNRWITPVANITEREALFMGLSK